MGGYDRIDVLVTDFDGTVVNEDLPHIALERYGRHGWQAVGARMSRGEVTFEDGLTAMYSMIGANQETVVSLGRSTTTLRRGFPALQSTCHENGIKIVVVSAGLDFLIRDAMERFDIRVDRLVCPTTKYEGGAFRARFPRFSPPSRNFKDLITWTWCFRNIGKG